MEQRTIISRSENIQHLISIHILSLIQGIIQSNLSNRLKAAGKHGPLSCIEGALVIGPRGAHRPGNTQITVERHGLDIPLAGRIPASISTNGIIHHRLVVDGQKLLAGTLGNGV